MNRGVVRAAALAAAMAAFLPSLSAQAPARRLREVRFWSLGDVTRIAVETTSVAEYKAERVYSPDRIFFDLPGTRRKEGVRGVETIPVNDALVKQIRVADTKPGVVRIVLDLVRPVDYSVSQLRHPDRLIIELRPAAPATAATLTTAEPAPTAAGSTTAAASTTAAPVPTAAVPEAPAKQTAAAPGTSPAASAKPDTPPPPPAVAASRDSSGRRSLIRALGLKLQRVVLDPGHGGHDTGTIGPTGLMEKDLVLDIAKRLGALIEERLGAEVIFTRTEDVFVPLEERTALATAKEADLFLSIHANSSRSARIAGPETFYLNFTTDQAAMDVAARENATSGETIKDYPALVEKIARNEKVSESREFAAVIQKALYSGLMRGRGVKDRGVKKAPFMVLIGTKVPAVLTEIAFLSNPRDERLLKRDDYRARVAEALFKGISEYAETLSRFEVAKQQGKTTER